MLSSVSNYFPFRPTEIQCVSSGMHEAKAENNMK